MEKTRIKTDFRDSENVRYPPCWIRLAEEDLKERHRKFKAQTGNTIRNVLPPSDREIKHERNSPIFNSVESLRSKKTD